MRLSTAPRAIPCVLVSSRRASRPKSARRSHRCASWGGWGDTHNARVRLPRRIRQHRRHDRYGLNRAGGGSGLPVESRVLQVGRNTMSEEINNDRRRFTCLLQ